MIGLKASGEKSLSAFDLVTASKFPFGQQMKCTHCGGDVPAHSRYCPVCLADCGFPNVRKAESQEECAALDKRVADAEVSCGARGCAKVLTEFGKAIQASSIVMAKSLGDLDSWIHSDNHLMVSYHQQVRSGARIPEENAWDRGRTAAESTIHPNYHEEIQYACISLNSVGVTAWGECHVLLKEALLAQRTTVFEENPFHFTQRHRVAAGQAPPNGYRAKWARRHQLAQAKLHAELQPSTKTEDFPGILVSQGATTGDADFIEAHVYGPLHRETIESVAATKPKNRADSVIWKRIRKKLDKLGARVQEL